MLRSWAAPKPLSLLRRSIAGLVLSGWLGAVAGGAVAELPGPDHRLQIAGVPLAEFPHFEVVRAFPRDQAVHGALDPTLDGGLAGRTLAVYVVAARSLEQWQADPALGDVAGAPRLVNLGEHAGDPASFLLAGPDTLAAVDGASLGVGYDVVVDLDDDGRLSAADLIDGLGDEAGFYVVHDITRPGPHAVASARYSGGRFLGQNLWYPSDIASLGQRPLVVISHGNGHDYTWYDYLGEHLASYGYVAMSHQNEVGPGPDTAATSTIENTDYLLREQASLAGGAIDGHVDPHRIVWIGHSRGAEGVVRAVHRLHTGLDTPEHFGVDDLALVSSMAPTDFLGRSRSNPHDVPFHLWTASGDIDVDGSAGCDPCQTFHLHDRATGARHSTVIQGAGHDDFHDEPGVPGVGVCPVGSQEVVHDVVKAHLLALIRHYVDGNVAASDFLWRPYGRFRPIGVDADDPCLVVSHEYRPPPEVRRFIIDDFQTQPSKTRSSADAPVVFSVENLSEGLLNDADITFEWAEDDPFNGATQASGRDAGRGIVFDWDRENRFIEWSIDADRRDFSAFTHIALRAAQSTQHPLTLADRGDLTFSIRLRDRQGQSRAIHLGAYAGGLVEPYEREGGWHNEMETVRLRLADFQRGGGPDLRNIAAVRLDFGPDWGAPEGRIVLDELMVTAEAPAIAPPLPWSASLETGFEGGALVLDVVASAPEAATLEAGVMILGPDKARIPLWSLPLDATEEPIRIRSQLPFPFSGWLIAFILLRGPDGVESWDLHFVYSEGAS